MSDSNGNGWKGWALAAVTGVLLGDGVSSFVAKADVGKLELKHDREVAEIETRADKDYDIIIAMSERLVRIETKLDALRP